MHLKVITPPSTPVVNLTDVKEYLRIDYSDEDATIEAMMMAAIDHAEKFIRRSLSPKTYELIVDDYHEQLTLPNPPLISVDQVTVIDSGDNETQITDFKVKEREPAILLSEYEGDVEEMRVQYQAGYENNLPKSIEQAIYLLTSHFYENRETVIVGTSVVKIPFSVESLLYPYKVRWF